MPIDDESRPVDLLDLMARRRALIDKTTSFASHASVSGFVKTLSLTAVAASGGDAMPWASAVALTDGIRLLAPGVEVAEGSVVAVLEPAMITGAGLAGTADRLRQAGAGVVYGIAASRCADTPTAASLGLDGLFVLDA